jgi:TctA family transporter
VLGIILGGPLEERFLQTMTAAGGSPVGFVNRPISALLGAVWVALWISMLAVAAHRMRASANATAPSPDDAPAEAATPGEVKA